MGQKGKRKYPPAWDLQPEGDPICKLCGRPMPSGSHDEHHMIPKTFGGVETLTLHRVCHEKLHHTFSEREMANYYHTIERLKESEHIRRFIKWISKQPPEYYAKHKDTNERNRKR